MCDCHECDKPIKRSQSDWDLFFFEMAGQAAGLSKDPDRKVGAVVVSPDRRQVSFGYNGFPAEVPDLPSLLADRDFKLANVVHAERNALRQCPFDPRGCTLYVTRFPCLECSTMVVLRGIDRVVAPEPDIGHRRWGESWRQARERMILAGIQLRTF
jgi:dCMP deaminase